MMKHGNTAARSDAQEEETATAEQVENYVPERPALMLTFLDVAERYSHAREQPPVRVRYVSA